MKSRLHYSLRNIKRNKINTIVTTVGLSIALACVFVIYLFVKQEKSYNSFHENADNIYRLNYNIIFKNGERGSSNLVDPDLVKELKDKVPQIAHCTPFRIGYMAQFDLEDRNLKIELGIAEQDFFDMFSLKLLHGNKDKLLVDPTNVVLTKSLAEKLNKNNSESLENLIGKTLKFTFIDKTNFTISGIIEDIPKNSTINFEAIIPYKYQGAFWQSNNDFGNSSLFYELRKEAVPDQANILISDVVKDFYKKNIENGQKSNLLSTSPHCFEPFMVPLKKSYLDNSLDYTAYESIGNKAQLNILIAVGTLILCIAFINFIILTIGQFFKKAGEVSIRKSIGGNSIDILKMFLNENSILIIASFLTGGVLCYLLIPVFNNIFQSQIYFNLVNLKMLIGFSLTLIILLISLTSIIPVFIFRNVKPTLLTTKKLFFGKKIGTSQVFIGFQYTLAIILIFATLIINKQTFYLKNKSLGFSEDNIIAVHVSYLDQSQSVVLRDMLKNQAGVINAALTNRDYFDGYSSCSFNVSNTEVMETYMFKADNYFIPTLDLNLLAGRNFTESEITPNNKSIIVNEEFVERMGFKGSPIGKTVRGCGDKYHIIGVVNNYQFLTSREKIEPMFLHANTNRGNDYSVVLLKYDPRNLSNVVQAIKKSWKEIKTKEELNYVFWDKELENRYKAEERLSKVIMYASIIAIIILTLGLFGLTVLISAQRTCEIGIRKVNGAKAWELLTMLNKEYIKWIIIAFIIAYPIGWVIMNKWLENFAYKINLSWWIFCIAGIIALSIALLTVNWQSWRAARRNPVEALRYE